MTSLPLSDADVQALRTRARQVLDSQWGYPSFRPLQEDIVVSVLSGCDTLGLLPTGGGKSITFQVPALILPGLTVVVTPLVSLMKDQVDNLLKVGVKGACLYSGLTRREYNLVMDRARLGKIKILYVSPERLRAQSFTDAMRAVGVSLIVVDEAHCISQWGYDFRPSYLGISSLRKLYPDAPVLALTASATPEVTADIMERLAFRPGFRKFEKSFARSNLSYIVRHCDFKEPMLLRVLGATAGSAIVYVRSRRRTREIADMLSREGISATFYHAGLASEEKAARQDAWKSGAIRVMVATNAFGMGIDKPDVRVVVHFDLPSSLEEYYQEAGRAGRDGLHSFAVLLVAKADKAVLTRRVAESFPPKGYVSRVYELAGNFLDVAVGEGYNRLYEFDFSEFCRRFDLKASAARNSLALLTRAGYVEYVDETDARSRVMMLMDRHELYSVRLDDMSDRVLQLLLRSYTGLFADYVHISESLLASRLEVTHEDVYRSMLTLTRAHVLHYIPRKSTPYLLYTTSREEPRYISLPLDVYERQRERMQRRVDAMKRFAFDGTHCRVAGMLAYFGEASPADCLTCDVCRGRRPQAPGQMSLTDAILYLASHPGGSSVAAIAGNLSRPVAEVADCVRRLADDGLVTLTGMNVVRK